MGKFIPHKIPAESIKEGDTITASWKVGEVEHTRTGKVARILFDHGKRSRSFIASDENEILHWAPGSRVVMTLVAETPVLGTELDFTKIVGTSAYEYPRVG